MSINTAHANGGVLIFTGERLVNTSNSRVQRLHYLFLQRLFYKLLHKFTYQFVITVMLMINNHGVHVLTIIFRI